MDRKINKYIDHTALKPSCVKDDIKKLCDEAKKFDFASVCVQPYFVKYASSLLEGTDVKICTVIGFPLGANTVETKVFETENAYKNGCEEFDMVINIGALKNGDLDYVRDEIKAVVAAAKGKCVKVIIETFYLTNEEKSIVSRLCCDAGATFVKTCTGFNDGIATAEDVRIIKESIVEPMKIKASAGIRTREQAIDLINAGADRIGTSAGIKIIEGQRG